MKRLIYSLLFLNFFYNTFAKEVNQDSLYKVYLNSKVADTLRLRAINEIVANCYYSTPESSMKFSRMMLQLGRSSGAAKWEALALNTIGFLYQNKREYSSALK